MDSQGPPKIPVIDFSREDLSPGTQTWLSTTKQVCHALEEYGCFIINCNEVSLDLRNSVYSALEDLFHLPGEIKRLIKATVAHPSREVFSTNPNHEGIMMDEIINSEGAQNFTNLLWPDGNDNFCESSREISKIMMNLDQMVVKMVFQHYGVEKLCESHIASIASVTTSSMYKKPEENENYLGFMAHTDKSFSTVLHQNDVNGLEIQTKDGQWILYNPSSHSSFLYLAGDPFKAWSNNRIHACNHKVKMSGIKTRFSVGLFTVHRGVIHVPDELVDEEHPLRYKPFNQREFVKLVKEDRMKKLGYTIEAHCGV